MISVLITWYTQTWQLTVASTRRDVVRRVTSIKTSPMLVRSGDLELLVV